ncbi:MAG: elongation factor G, partial [Kosmotoga sp.]
EKGIKNSMDSGILAGYPIVDIKVTLLDGSFHEVDSSEMAFSAAGAKAFRKGLRKAKPTLLEPIMDVEILTPKEYMGDVIGDVNGRRGSVKSMEPKENIQIIKAEVPLSEMFGYATALRTITQGRANYSMEFSYYDEVPMNKSEELIGE